MCLSKVEGPPASASKNSAPTERVEKECLFADPSMVRNGRSDPWHKHGRAIVEGRTVSAPSVYPRCLLRFALLLAYDSASRSRTLQLVVWDPLPRVRRTPRDSSTNPCQNDNRT